MTDTTITPVATEQTATETPPAPPDTTPAAPTKGVEHTAGGWPVVPLALTGTNTTATLLAGAALVGGPVALAVAATGAAVLGTAAATRNRRDQHRTTRAGSDKRAQGARQGRVPLQRTATNRTGGTGRAVSTGRPAGKTGLGSGAGSGGRLSNRRSVGAAAGRPAKGKAPGGSGLRPSGGAKAVRGRLGQVKALRAAARQGSPSRAVRRSGTTGARRSLADTRRAAKAHQRSASLAGKGPVGRAVGKAAGRVGKARGAAVERSRKARDARAAGQVAAGREQVRKAPARKRARKALVRSAARFQRRRLLAGLLAGALGLVGLVSTPLGRKLGWAWLQHPGRRLYGQLMRTASEERAARDRQIHAARQEDEAAVDAEAADDPAVQIGDQAERPAGVVPATPGTTTTSEGESVSGFRFEEHAAEMESAAQQYDPDNAMEILAMVEGLPAALTSVANVMRVLAERADSEFPLEKEVADGFNDIFGAVMSAVAVAEDMGPLFRQAHEQDIARHEDPRNGPEAEKGWNV